MHQAPCSIQRISRLMFGWSLFSFGEMPGGMRFSGDGPLSRMLDLVSGPK